MLVSKREKGATFVLMDKNGVRLRPFFVAKNKPFASFFGFFSRGKVWYNSNMDKRFSRKFIAATERYGTFEKPVSAPCFRRTFTLNAPPKNAELYLCGLGFYRLFFNGKELTKGRLAPYIFNPDVFLYYDRYDLTGRLKKGKNVLAAVLGNGFLNDEGGKEWGGDRAAYRSAPKLALTLFVNGRKRLEADGKFRVAPSPILFDDLRAGEAYDGRRKLRGWTGLAFDDSGWAYAIPAVTPKGLPKLCETEPIRVIERRKPVKIVRTEKGFLYDFGLNGAGVCRLKIRNAERGQTLVLTHGELTIDGALYIGNITSFDRVIREKMHKAVYVCAGEKVETYTPSFTYYGFRYVEVEGLREEQATDELLTAEYLFSDVENAGFFTCSDEVTNKIERAVRNADRANLLHIPTDCPHREKQGWTGDLAASAVQFFYNFHVEKTLGEWLENLIAHQRPDGELPAVVPNTGEKYEKNIGPSWDVALAYLTCELYRFTGEKKYLTTGAAALEKYLRFMERQRGENGLFDFGIGDWCQAGTGSAGAFETKRELTSSVSVYESAKGAAFAFGELGWLRQKARAEKFARRVRAAIRREYLVRGRLKREYATQTAYAILVCAGIFTEREKLRAVRSLVALIEAGGGKMSVGVLGHRRVFRVLADYGYAELAYQMIRGPQFPSYGYFTERGATALPEFFAPLEDREEFVPVRRRASFNHHFFGDVSAWFKEYIGGIRINPDYRQADRVVFDFCFIERLAFAEASYRHPLGLIRTRWVRKDGKIWVRITVPKGLRYEIKRRETGVRYTVRTVASKIF